MPTVIQCPACLVRFNTTDRVAGRRVRCRSCGEIISVPARAGQAPAAGDLPAGNGLERLDAIDLSGGPEAPPSVVRSRTRVVVEPPTDADAVFEAAAGHFEPGRSANPYYFPLNREVDRWLPVAMIAGALIWMASQALNPGRDLPGWVGGVRLLVLVLGFVIVIVPATYIAMRQVSQRLRFPLPSFPLWRTATVFSVPYGIGASMWLIHGDFAGLFIGSLIGLVLGLSALWLLMHLQPEEGPTALAVAGGAYVGAAVVVAVVVVGLNAVVLASVRSSDKPTTLAASPLGPGLPWVPPPPKPKRVVPPPTEQEQPVVSQDPLGGDGSPGAVAGTGGGGGGNTPAGTNPEPAVPPVATGAPGAVVQSIARPIPGEIQQVILPATPGPWVGVMRAERNRQTIVERWSIGGSSAAPGTPKPQGEAVFSAADVYGTGPNVYQISPSGMYLARLSRFPKLSIQVWSFLEDRLSRTVKLDPKLGTPTLLGFAGPEQLLVHWQKDAFTAVDTVNVRSGVWAKRIETGSFEPSPVNYTISDDGKRLAVVTREETSAAVEVHAIGRERGRKRIEIDQLEWGPEVRVAGVAFAHERPLVAALFVHSGQGLFLGWHPTSGEMQHQHLFPGGVGPAGGDANQFETGAVSLLDRGRAWVMFGSKIHDTATGRALATTDVIGAKRQYVLGNVCCLVHPTESGFPTLAVVTLDLASLRRAAEQVR